MRWDRNYSSNEIEDRRGEGFSGGGGGMGGAGLFGLFRLASLFGWKGILVALIIAGVVGVGGGGLGMCSGGSSSPMISSQHRAVQSSAQEDELVHFVGFVFDDIQKSWRGSMPSYRDSRLVLFRNGTQSACGTASTAIGPFYCPLDKKVYLDLSFYDELRTRFGAPGDFAEAYVIAHEVGHHVQNQLGLLGRGAPDSVHVELQADCLAGAWAQDAEKRGLLEMGDIDEALNAASQIGDDTLQRKATGHVQPEKFTHGTSAQRKASFQKGYDGGANACL